MGTSCSSTSTVIRWGRSCSSYPPASSIRVRIRVECAARELAEETGWRAGEIHDLGSFFTTPGFTDEVLHAFVATGLEPAPDIEADPDEAIEIVTMTVEEALEACRDGRIRDGKTLATFLLAQLNGYI